LHKLARPSARSSDRSALVFLRFHAGLRSTFLDACVNIAIEKFDARQTWRRSDPFVSMATVVRLQHF
jgi:hypothetical protein